MFDTSLPGRDGWVLKGYALEMRFHRARATKDLDLTVRVTSIGQTPPNDLAAALRERLQLAASVELADFFVFNVGEASLELSIKHLRAARGSPSTPASTVAASSSSMSILASATK